MSIFINNYYITIFIVQSLLEGCKCSGERISFTNCLNVVNRRTAVYRINRRAESAFFTNIHCNLYSSSYIRILHIVLYI